MDAMDGEKLTITVDECAKMLGISRGLCFQMVHEGTIPHLRFHKRILIPKWGIERLLQEPKPSSPTPAGK